MNQPICITFLLWISASQQVFSQTYSYETEPSYNNGWWTIEQTAVKDLVSSLKMSLPPEQKSIVDSINIVWTDAPLSELPHAFIANDGSRQVRISKAFVNYLFQYIQLTTLALFVDELDVPTGWNLPEAWTFGIGERYGANVDLRNPAIWGPTQPLGFFQLSESDTIFLNEKLFSQMYIIYNNALFDVLMHEIGHHVVNSFYSPNASFSEVHAAELRVDNWVGDVIENPDFQFGGSGIHIFGRAFALAASLEISSYQSFFGVEGGQIDGMRFRAIDNGLEDLCFNVSHLPEINDTCTRIEKFFLETVFVVRNDEHYQNRAESGESYANFFLGLKATRTGELLAACEYFHRASQLRYADSVLAEYLAQCHWRNVFEIETHRANRLAAEHLCNSVRHGWLSSSSKLEEFRVYLDDDITCGAE